eukprot:13460619-Alexandrium_andersonii.AAC.1
MRRHATANDRHTGSGAQAARKWTMVEPPPDYVPKSRQGVSPSEEVGAGRCHPWGPLNLHT